MADEPTFTDSQQRELQTSLVETLKADDGLKDTFCKCWPCAKDVLQIILKNQNLPPIVTTVINGIIKAGDQAYGTLCKSVSRQSRKGDAPWKVVGQKGTKNFRIWPAGDEDPPYPFDAEGLFYGTEAECRKWIKDHQ